MKDSLGLPLLTLKRRGKGQMRSMITHMSVELCFRRVRRGLVWHQEAKRGREKGLSMAPFAVSLVMYASTSRG